MFRQSITVLAHGRARPLIGRVPLPDKPLIAREVCSFFHFSQLSIAPARAKAGPPKPTRHCLMSHCCRAALSHPRRGTVHVSVASIASCPPLYESDSITDSRVPDFIRTRWRICSGYASVGRAPVGPNFFSWRGDSGYKPRLTNPHSLTFDLTLFCSSGSQLPRPGHNCPVLPPLTYRRREEHRQRYSGQHN